MRFKTATLIRLTAFCFVLVCLQPVLAQRTARYQTGDIIHYYKFSDWKEGTVVAVNKKGAVLVNVGSGRQEVFVPSAVRWPYEAGALARSREWSDASGTFKIEAAPIGIVGEKVRLRKPDMAELEVELGLLSDSDQRYLSRIKRQAGTLAGGVPTHPELETFAGSDSSLGKVVLPFSPNGKTIAIEPDPIPDYMRLKEGSVVFPKPDDSDELSLVLPIGGPDAWLLTALSNERDDNFPTRLIWASIAKRKISSVLMLPVGEVVLDYHPRSHRLLTYNQIKSEDIGFDKQIALTLWEVLPTDEAITPVMRWDGSASNKRWDKPWGRIIDGNLVLHRRDKQEYVCWDTSKKEVRYVVKQEAHNAPKPIMSGSNRYVFLPEAEQIRIFNPIDGAVITTLPVENGCSGLAVSDDGKKLAVLDRNSLAVFDLTDPASKPRKYQAETIGSYWETDLGWYGSDRILVHSTFEMAMFSLKHKMPVWNYRFGHGTVRGDDTHRTKVVINDHLAFGASFYERGNRGFVVGNVELPGPLVEERIAEFDFDNIHVMEKGVTVQLVVDCGKHNEYVWHTLNEKIRENGWILTEGDAHAIMEARMYRGNTQATTYELSDGRRETVSFTPHISSLRVIVDNEDVWVSSTQTGAPGYIRLRSGESVQSKVGQYEQTDPIFFGSRHIPAQLVHPKWKKGMGTTGVTTRGLIPEK